MVAVILIIPGVDQSELTQPMKDLLALTQYFISILRLIRFQLIPANPTTTHGSLNILVAHLLPLSCQPIRPII